VRHREVRKGAGMSRLDWYAIKFVPGV